MTSNYKIAVIGSSSMVGSRFCELSKELNLIKADLNGDITIDITNKNSTLGFFQKHKPEIAIVFSAFTDVNTSEDQRGNKDGLCWKINVEGVKNIVESAKIYPAKIIFISTDFVFDGSRGPYSEEDKVGPDFSKMTWYGITKVEGEKLVETLPNFIILRISFPYRAKYDKKPDFARKLLSTLENNVSLYDNQIISPTFADDVAPVIRRLIEVNANGIYHLASPETTTPYKFALYLAKVFNKDETKIKAGRLETNNAGKRPVKAGMKTEKISHLGFTPTAYKDGIVEIAKQLGIN